MLATITTSWLFRVLVILMLCDDVTRGGSFAIVITRDNPWAGSISSIGIFAGSMQTKGGDSDFYLNPIVLQLSAGIWVAL